jgi:hypothetical protein
VSVPAQDSVITFPSFSAARAWPPKTSGTSASAAILMMCLIAASPSLTFDWSQLCRIGRDPSRLIFGEQLGRTMPEFV